MEKLINTLNTMNNIQQNLKNCDFNEYGKFPDFEFKVIRNLKTKTEYTKFKEYIGKQAVLHLEGVFDKSIICPKLINKERLKELELDILAKHKKINKEIHNLYN